MLQRLQIDLAQVSITGVREGPEESLALLLQAFELRDCLFSQALQALLHKKTVLWMDLGIGNEEYVKNEVFEATRRAIDSFNAQGYLSSKVEYFHPRLETGLPSIREQSTATPVSSVPEVVHSLISFADGFQDMTAMIEKNFQLSISKKSNPAVSTLRDEIEAAYQRCTRLEEENQNLKTLLRSPDRREWVNLNREVDTLKEELEQANRNIQRLTADKHILSTENGTLRKSTEDLGLKLTSLKENVYPKLEEIEKLYSEMVQELKNVRQDSELLPVLFRNEAQVKFAMRDEMIQAQELLKVAEEVKEREVQRAAKLEEERNRKERIALQAIAARNSMESDFKLHQRRVVELESAIKQSQASFLHMKQETERYKAEHSELQAHVFVLNNRINELEEHKKTLLEQVKSLGSASKVHHLHRRLHAESPKPN